MRHILTFLLLLLISIPAHAGTSIWGSPQRTTTYEYPFSGRYQFFVLSRPRPFDSNERAISVRFAGTITGDTFGTGVPTFLETPSSAKFAGAVTDENGSGKLIFSNGTLTIANGKTLTVSNTLTFTGTIIERGVRGRGHGALQRRRGGHALLDHLNKWHWSAARRPRHAGGQYRCWQCHLWRRFAHGALHDQLQHVRQRGQLDLQYRLRLQHLHSGRLRNGSCGR